MTRVRIAVIHHKKTDRVKPGDTYRRINNTANQGGLTAENPRHQIKAEESDQPPVDRADNDNCQNNLIPDVIHDPASFKFCRSGVV